jgi:hypothetical protein
MRGQEGTERTGEDIHAAEKVRGYRLNVTSVEMKSEN